MSGIIDQPIYYDVWRIIFKNLSIKDLLTCRLVNKLFKYFSDHTNGINKLIIGRPVYEDNNYCFWHFNYKLIDDEDVISLKCFKAIQELSIFNLDKYLKYLKINDHQLQLKELSNLINLEFIEFRPNFSSSNRQIVNFRNLKFFVSYNCSVQLNTPKLEKIQFIYMFNIKLNSNPELIKHLITESYDNGLEIFKNLQIMELRSTNKPTNENVLSLFKNLKKLKINLKHYKVDYSNERIKNSLIKILNNKVKLKRSIDIYLEGIKIENINNFNELVSIISSGNQYWQFRLTNYDLLDLNLPFIDKLYYHELEGCVNIKNDLPSSFFDKFICINWVDVSSVNDIDGLNWFLNKLKYLKTLYIDYNVSLDEVFYNNLPDTIKVLEIDNRSNINYEFILKLSKLIGFYTKVDKDLFDLALQSFLNLKYLEEFRFYFKNKEIKIKKNGKYFYLNHGIRRQLDYNQLIEECNKLKLDEEDVDEDVDEDEDE